MIKYPVFSNKQPPDEFCKTLCAVCVCECKFDRWFQAVWLHEIQTQK